MKESDYTLATDLARVRIMKSIMRDHLTPDEVIPAHEHRRVCRILELWNLRLYTRIDRDATKEMAELADLEVEWSEDKGKP